MYPLGLLSCYFVHKKTLTKWQLLGEVVAEVVILRKFELCFVDNAYWCKEKNISSPALTKI